MGKAGNSPDSRFTRLLFTERFVKIQDNCFSALLLYVKIRSRSQRKVIYFMEKSVKKRYLFPALSLFLLLLLSVLMLWYQYQSRKPAARALITQNGSLIREVSLTDVDAPYTFTIESPQGGYNVIRVEEGKIGVTDTDCPDKICQNMGMVSSSVYPISCLPHRLVIQIEGDLSEGPDSVAR